MTGWGPGPDQNIQWWSTITVTSAWWARRSTIAGTSAGSVVGPIRPPRWRTTRARPTSRLSLRRIRSIAWAGHHVGARRSRLSQLVEMTGKRSTAASSDPRDRASHGATKPRGERPRASVRMRRPTSSRWPASRYDSEPNSVPPRTRRWSRPCWATSHRAAWTRSQRASGEP